MAKSHALVFLASTALFTQLMLVGCQSNKTIVDRVPPPSFAGPTIQPSAPSVAPAPHWTPPPVAQAPAPKGGMGTIPKSWKPQVAARQWNWIVIHHSATPGGSAKTFDRMHKDKGWDELGYHFVIGNGTETSDGAIEVGPRWPKQKWGAHAKTPDNQYNDYGIGICLVGNFDIERPTANQMRSLAKLVAYLEKTYKIPPSRVIGHGDTKPTDCPGRNMSVASVRKMASQMLADGGEGISDESPAHARTAGSAELLGDAAR